MRAGPSPSEAPAAGPPPLPPGRFAALANREFRLLFASNLAFFLAMGSQGLVRGWLAFQLTHSELKLGLVGFAVAVPMFLAAPLGGVIADRRERRGLIAAGQASVVLLELAILALLLAGALEFWHLLAAAAGMGCVFPFIMPARQAIVANLVGRSGLASAIAINMTGMNVTRVVGPALGGFLVAGIGIEPTYGLGVVLYALALVLLLQIRPSHPDLSGPKRSVRASLVEGIHYMREQPLVLVLLLFGLIPMFLAMPFQQLLPAFAEKIWHEGSDGLGLLSALAGAGGVLGSMIVAWTHDADGRARRQLLSMFGFGGFLVLFSFCPWFWGALPLVFVANVFASIHGTLNSTAIQLLIPDRVRGRISSFLMMSFSLPMLGALPISAGAEAFGAPLAVGVASALAVLIALAFYAASPRLRHMDEAVLRGMDREPGEG